MTCITPTDVANQGALGCSLWTIIWEYKPETVIDEIAFAGDSSWKFLIMYDACKEEMCALIKENCYTASDHLKLLSFSDTTIDSMRAKAGSNHILFLFVYSPHPYVCQDWSHCLAQTKNNS